MTVYMIYDTAATSTTLPLLSQIPWKKVSSLVVRPTMTLHTRDRNSTVPQGSKQGARGGFMIATKAKPELIVARLSLRVSGRWDGNAPARARRAKEIEYQRGEYALYQIGGFPRQIFQRIATRGFAALLVFFPSCSPSVLHVQRKRIGNEPCGQWTLSRSSGWWGKLII